MKSFLFKSRLDLFFVAIAVLFFCSSAKGIAAISSDSISHNPFVLGLRQHYGFVIIHSREIRAIKDSYPTGTELTASWQKMDKKSWDLCNCYPRSGILLSFFDFDNKKILGYGFNLAGFIEPFFRSHKKKNS